MLINGKIITYIDAQLKMACESEVAHTKEFA